MASLVESKRRVASVSSTQKVIKAMEMVASSKVKKARDKAKDGQFFFDTAIQALADVYNSDEMRDTIFPIDNDECTLIIAITSDMGLCGAYNSNVSKEVVKCINEESKCKTIVVGKKGIAKLKYEGYEINHQIIDTGSKSEIELADEIMAITTKYVKEKSINNIKIIYTDYINPISQIVKSIDISDLSIEIEKVENKCSAVMQIEPSANEIFDTLFEIYIGGVIYSTILQSFASEHSFRRNSMEAANKNSLELIDKLNIEMNRIRQGIITQEITEIIGGSEVLNKE